MKKNLNASLKIFFLLFSFLILFFLLLDFAYAAPIGKFTDIKGGVDITMIGKDSRPARLGDGVNLGDIVQTKSESKAEITFVDSNIIRLLPASRVKISEYLVEKDQSKEIFSLFRGTVQSIVKTAHTRIFGLGKKNLYEVHTPTAVIGVRGSEFRAFFNNGVSGAIFDKGSGYCYNINLPDILKHINTGQGMLVLDPTKPPVIKPATDPLFQKYMDVSGLMKLGQDVSKGDIKITDARGESIKTTMIEIPSEDAPKDKPIDIVKEDWKINAGYDYIIDAEGHKAKKVKGSDLIKQRGVQLNQEPERFAVVPSGESPEDIGKEVALALYILTGEAEKDQEKEARFLLDYHLKNMREKIGMDVTETEKDKGIESVVEHLQPIFIFDTNWEPSREILEAWNLIAKDEVKPHLGILSGTDSSTTAIPGGVLFGVDSIFSVYGTPESGDKKDSATEKATDMFAFEWLSPDDDIAIDEFDDTLWQFRYKVHFGEPYWERRKKQERLLSRPDLFKDIRPDLFKDVIPDDPGVDKTFNMPGLDFWSGGRTWDRKPLIIKDDLRSIQQKENIIFINQEDILKNK